MGLLLPFQQPDRVGGQRGHSHHHVPAGARGADGRRRLQPDERPQQVRRGHHPGRARLGELSRRHRPGLLRQHTHPVPGGRPGPGPVRRQAQLLPRALLPVGVQARRGHHRGGAGGGGDAPGLPPPAQRTAGTGDRRDPCRRRRTGGTGVGAGLPAAQASLAVAVPERRGRRGAPAAERPQAGHLVGDGRPVRIGDERT